MYSPYATRTIVVVLIVWSTMSQAAPKRTIPKSSTKRQNLPLNLCKSSANISSAMKKYLKNVIISVMSTCTLKVITIVSYPWGTPADVLSFLPRGLELICITIRGVYALYSNDKGRLPRSIARNATVLLDQMYIWFKTYLRDSSISRDVCAKPTKSHRARVCYPKEQVLQVVDHSMPCLRAVLKESLPESMDAALYGMSGLFERVANTAVVSYLSSL